MEQAARVEPRINDHLFRIACTQKLPLSGTFELTPMCNLSCRMCYVRKTAEEVRNHPRRMLRIEDWLKLAEAAKAQGTLYLLLTGGEPLSVPFFRELYEKLIRMGFVISINTNATLIDDAMVEFFKRLPPLRINITLYGASDATYERLCRGRGMYSRVDRAIRSLHEAGIQVKLNGTVTPDNIADIPEIIRYAEELGIIYETATYMFPPVRRDPSSIGVNARFTPRESAEADCMIYRLQHGEERYRKYLELIRRGAVPPPELDENCIDPADGTVRCRAGSATFWASWDGFMTPCGMMPEPKVDLLALGFEEAWKQTVANTAEIRLSGICKTCPDKKLCHTCAAMAYAETGSASGIPAYLCEKVRALRTIAAASDTAS